MKTEDNNRVNMIDATIGFCDLNPTPTTGITNFALRLADVKAKKILIDGMNQLGSASTKGVTTDVGVLRATMTNLAVKCANATIAFANATNNNTLKAQVNFTGPKLDKMAKEDVDDICQQIHDAADANVVAVTPYGIVASDVTDLQAAIDLYRAKTGNTRQAIINRSQAKRQGSLMIRELIDELLVGQMDKMVNTIKLTEDAYWHGYFQAREIIQLGSTSAKVRGTVLDEEDVPLIGVLFTIYEAGTLSIVRQVTSKAKGKFDAAKLPSGDFDFKWELDGYTTKTENNVHISPGKELKRKVVMSKNGAPINITREGDLGIGVATHVNTDDVETTAETTITIEVTGSTFRIYGAPTNTSLPGAQFLDVFAGAPVTKTLTEFETLTGLGEANPFLMIQNIGVTNGHWKITFNNVAP